MHLRMQYDQNIFKMIIDLNNSWHGLKWCYNNLASLDHPFYSIKTLVVKILVCQLMVQL
jgi:hypothetical protein